MHFATRCVFARLSAHSRYRALNRRRMLNRRQLLTRKRVHKVRRSLRERRIRQMTQHRHNLAHATAIRFDVGVPRSPARCLVSSAQHNVAINLRTARRDSDTESRPLRAPDFNLCTVILDVTEEKQGEANLLGLHRFHLRRHCWSGQDESQSQDAAKQLLNTAFTHPSEFSEHLCTPALLITERASEIRFPD